MTTSHSRRFTPNLRKNHDELYQILQSLNPKLRNDPRILKSEYEGLKGKLYLREKLLNENRLRYCNNCKGNHLPYFCNYSNCDICGIRGHQRQICDTPIYYVNLLYLCGCDGRRCKNIRSRLNKKRNSIARHSTHCCECNNPTSLENMMKFGNRMICEYCENRNKNKQTKRPMTPPSSPRPDKQVKSIIEKIDELPPPEDPMEDVDLTSKPIPTTLDSTLTYAEIVSHNTSQAQIRLNHRKNI